MSSASPSETITDMPSALEECFLDRLNTLTRLKQIIPHYKAALETNSAEDYLGNVSESWSPIRAGSVPVELNFCLKRMLVATPTQAASITLCNSYLDSDAR